MSRTAAELCRHHQIPLGAEASALLDDGLSCRAYFDRLLAQDHYADARRFLVHVLSRRRALWWGCLCADALAPHAEADRADLEAVARYAAAYDDDDARRDIVTRAQTCLPDNPTRCLVMAAFFSGGSISVPEQPFVGPKPFVAGRLVSTAVYLAAVTAQPLGHLRQLRDFVNEGLRLALGADPWTLPDFPSDGLAEQLRHTRRHLSTSLDANALAVELASTEEIRP